MSDSIPPPEPTQRDTIKTTIAPDRKIPPAVTNLASVIESFRVRQLLLEVHEEEK
jgi:hypothetical protein